MDPNQLIVGVYYQGARGPTIILKALSESSVEWLHGIFTRLAGGSDSGIDLVAMPEVSIQGVRVLNLEQVAEQPDIALQCTSRASQGAEFRWVQDSLCWSHAAMLLEPFLSGKTGHQYLTQEGQDAALVEISFGEPNVLAEAV
jgi:hypothetical protein